MAPLILAFRKPCWATYGVVNTWPSLGVLAGCTRNSKFPGRPAMPRKPLLLAFYALLGCCFAISSHPAAKEARPVYPDLTAHEWGTFTSIAGKDGNAVEWLPLTGSTDLPSFVEHFRNAGFKLGLRGTVRMETPVLYFYDSREETVSVKVSFAKGVITEWYPRSTRVEPTANIFDGTLLQPHPDGSISWNSVTVSPNRREKFPSENSDNHYYAARMTSSTPLRVQTSAGEQQEKFLFYRGVSTFSVPLSAALTPTSKLHVENHGQEEIPNIILFNRREERWGCRTGAGRQKDAIMD